MQDFSNTRVMAAMSGGVDSSVCALLLKDAGYEVAGATCRMFDASAIDGSNGSSPDSDIADARQACCQLGIEHHEIDCTAPFRDCVIDAFVDSYMGGLTPNPCIDCNRHVKFGTLDRERERLGFDKLATGHYARVDFDEQVGRWRIRRADHASKDQSYMLCQLSQEQLSHAMFPLGALTKNEVRAIAESAGLASARKSDSQDICFVPDGDYASFVERAFRSKCEEPDPRYAAGRGCIPPEEVERMRRLAIEEKFAPGPIVDADGKMLGEHAGLLHYTTGQRKGIGIGGGKPLYVLAKDAFSNTLVVGTADELLACTVEARDVNFVSIPEASGFRARAKTSYRQEPRPATVSFDGRTLEVSFDEKTKRPAPGQALALYDIETGETLLAGATIC